MSITISKGKEKDPRAITINGEIYQLAADSTKIVIRMSNIIEVKNFLFSYPMRCKNIIFFNEEVNKYRLTFTKGDIHIYIGGKEYQNFNLFKI